MNIFSIRLMYWMVVLAAIVSVSLILPAVSAQGAGSTQNAKNNVLDNVNKAAGNSGGNLKTQGEVFPGGDLPTIFNRIIKTFFSLLAIIAISMVLYGGYNWLTSMGEEDKVEIAKKTITSAVIGIIIILAAYAITAFVIRSMFKASGGGGTPQGEVDPDTGVVSGDNPNNPTQ